MTWLGTADLLELTQAAGWTYPQAKFATALALLATGGDDSYHWQDPSAPQYEQVGIFALSPLGVAHYDAQRLRDVRQRRRRQGTMAGGRRVLGVAPCLRLGRGTVRPDAGSRHRCVARLESPRRPGNTPEVPAYRRTGATVGGTAAGPGERLGI